MAPESPESQHPEVVSFEEIGRKLRISTERARQIYLSAIYKIRRYLLTHPEFGEAIGSHLDDSRQPGLRYPKTPEQTIHDFDC